MGRVLKTYSRRKYSKYKKKQPISVNNINVSVINVFHSTSQDTFDELLKKDRMSEDSASVFTQPVGVLHISDSFKFFKHGFDYMKDKNGKTSETESSSSLLFKDPYSLVHLGISDKKQKTKKELKIRNDAYRIKRKMLRKRKPLKDTTNVNLRSDDKRKQSEIKCVTSSSTPLTGKIPSNHAVIPFSPIMSVKKTLFCDQEVCLYKNEPSVQVANDCVSRASQTEFCPCLKPTDIKQDKSKSWDKEQNNLLRQKTSIEGKNDIREERSNEKNKVNQQPCSPDFFDYFEEDKADPVVCEHCSTSSRETSTNIKQHIEAANDLNINEQLKQLCLSDCGTCENEIEKECNKGHEKTVQNQIFGEGNSNDYVTDKDNILSESTEECEKQNSENNQDYNNILNKTLEQENSGEWKTLKHSHEISKNKSKWAGRASVKLKDMNESKDEHVGHIKNSEDVNVNGLTKNCITNREQDSYITLQPGKQWRRSLLIHRRNRRSLRNSRDEDPHSRLSVQPEQIVKCAQNLRYSIYRRDSSSDFLRENVEKDLKAEKFNLKSYTIKEEDETDVSYDRSSVISSSRSVLNGLDADVKSNYTVNGNINNFNSSMFVKNVSLRKRPRKYSNLEDKPYPNSTIGRVNYGTVNNNISGHDEDTVTEDSSDKWRKSCSFHSESGFLGFSYEITNADTVPTDGLDNERGLGTQSLLTDVECNDDLAVDIQRIILDICEQDRLIPFEEFLCGREQDECRKLGEGTYGEVFLLQSKDESVLKVIPVEGRVIVNGENQKTFLEIISEMIISKQLSKLRDGMENNTENFCYVKHIWCLQGRYPDRLKELWDVYSEKKGSENDSPEIFEEDQKYIALELNNGGIPLLSFCFSSARQAFSVFLQTVFALAVAEHSCEFEHRDLHSGNLLINRCKQKQIHFRIDSVDYNIPTFGVQATVIDYTLSRINFDGIVLFSDLSKDPEMFQGVGDYQFDIYRIMREDVNNVWSEYAPVTNIRWLHYLLDKILQKGKYNNTKTKTHKKFVKQLESIYYLVPDFESATEVAQFFCTTYIDTMSFLGIA